MYEIKDKKGKMILTPTGELIWWLFLKIEKLTSKLSHRSVDANIIFFVYTILQPWNLGEFRLSGSGLC